MSLSPIDLRLWHMKSPDLPIYGPCSSGLNMSSLDPDVQGTQSKHVDLYRRLQSKWQCFDAYARVCMALGANQLLGVASRA